jgi:hypothetical protein
MPNTFWASQLLVGDIAGNTMFCHLEFVQQKNMKTNNEGFVRRENHLSMGEFPASHV